ncbi:MAG: hypothetical protein H8D45_04445 [Bacteroidetes bacterium]|nr:hypothetical protein [Bacteroidota bacterium]
MRAYIRYLVLFLFLIVIFRFFGFIMSFAIRFWYIILPLILIFYYYIRKQKESLKFRKTTGLDPEKEVKLKKEPKIEVEDDEK